MPEVTTDDEGMGGGFTFERGQRLMHADPRIEQMVVLSTGVINHYRALRIAEQDAATGEWSASWVKQRYIGDEVSLGLTDAHGRLAEPELTLVESRCVDSRDATDAR